MLDEYVRFYAAATTTSAGFAGLLLVALSVVNRDESQHLTRERRTVLAAGSFLALADIFFVSLVSSLGGTRVLATTSLVMALAGLLGMHWSTTPVRLTCTPPIEAWGPFKPGRRWKVFTTGQLPSWGAGRKLPPHAERLADPARR